MPEFEVHIKCSYQAEEEIDITVTADDQDGAEEIAQNLADGGKLVGDNKWGEGVEIFSSYDDPSYEIEYITKVSG